MYTLGDTDEDPNAQSLWPMQATQIGFPALSVVGIVGVEQQMEALASK